MDTAAILILLVLSIFSIGLSWWSVSDQALRRKKLAAKGRKHLRVVRSNERKKH